MKDIETQIIHHAYQAPGGFAAAQPPVHRASTVVFDSVRAMHESDWRDKSAYTYGLHGTPTTFTLEERLCTLEGGRFCTLAPSGLAAITLVNMALLQAGDEVLLPDNVYGPNASFVSVELAKWGITHQMYDPLDANDLAGRINSATRLVWIEAAGSVSLEFPDGPALVQAVAQANTRRDRKICTVLDNTWGAGLAFKPFEWGVDISVQALTKYPSGGADVLMGSVITRDPDLHSTVQMTHSRLGLGVAGDDAERVLRGLPSMRLRYLRQDHTTRELAQWAQSKSEFSRVLHPALAGSPGHEAFSRLCDGAACLFSVVFDKRFSREKVEAFCDALQLFQLGYSWAGPMSLVVPYQLPAMRTLPVPYDGVLVRFAVGLESPRDLIEDLEQALASIG